MQTYWESIDYFSSMNYSSIFQMCLAQYSPFRMLHRKRVSRSNFWKHCLVYLFVDMCRRLFNQKKNEKYKKYTYLLILLKRWKDKALKNDYL